MAAYDIVIRNGQVADGTGKKLFSADVALKGDRITALSADSDFRFLCIAARPLNEPIARYGPFVMNTPQEVHQAFEDYRSGQMGSINF
jgi:redox-sensitive bicupin YhaK (pirin superfamily)